MNNIWMRRALATHSAWALIALSAAPVALAHTVFDAPAANFQGKVFSPGALPGQAAPGLYPVVVQAKAPTAALVYDLKVSPDVPAAGQDRYAVQNASVRDGLYQIAYGVQSKSLFVPSSPAKDSDKLFKLDPNTLKVVAEQDVAVAAFGITADDTHATVWVTNSPAGSVAVYRQSDLSLVKQFDKGSAPHARDVVIDTELNKAYVSTMESRVVVFDTQNNSASTLIAIQSAQRGDQFQAFALALDAKAHKVYAASLATGEIAVINARSNTVEKLIAVEGIKGANGVAVDGQAQRLFVASQGNDTVAVVDLASGKTLTTTPVGASPLNIAFDAARQQAYVSTRGAGTVTVLDTNGKIVANLPVGTLTNHAAIDAKGTVYVVNKAPETASAQGDRITRIVPKD